jgi:predicted dehydrogenase
MPLAPKNPLRIGILGCANIARQFARDVSSSALVKIVAVASRDPDKAAEFAAAFGIERHHRSYDALVSDPQVDAIYVPLPNSLHAPWCIRAAEQGKHVLCEKPLALNLGEVTAMFAAARQHQVMLLESYPYWFQPKTASLLALLGGEADSVIGQVRSVYACTGFTLPNPETNIRSKPELGGGALLDAGSYPLSFIRLVMGCAPASVTAEASWGDSGVDISMMATLRYADGRRAQMSCAMNTANHRRAIITGSQGTIETEYLNHTSDAPGHPWGYLPSQLRVRRGTAMTIPFEEITAPSGSGFRFAAEAFARVVAERDFAAIDRAAAASMDIAATLDAIAASARTGQAVSLAV